MSILNSWCDRLFVISLVILITIFLADCKYYFLPIHGIWLILYIVFIIISTIWVICINIKKLLQRTLPFQYNIESNPYLNNLKSVCKLLQIPLKTNQSKEIAKKTNNNGSQTPKIENKSFTDATCIIPESKKLDPDREKSIDDRIEILVNDIEQKFIAKWYTHISGEETFPAESKILLEGIIRRFLQVSVQIDSGKVVCGALVILLKHLKEYRKAVKRTNKNGGSVEEVYRFSHIGNKSETALEHFTQQLTTNVLREFISWELWNSLPCRLLSSILSKRLTTYLIYYISQPGWLNYKIVSQLASKNEISDLKLEKYCYISLSDVDLSNKLVISVKKCSEISKSSEKIKDDVQKSEESATPKMSPKREPLDSPLPPNDTNLPKLTKSTSSSKSSQIDSSIQSESLIEQALTKMIKQHTAPILQAAKTAENTRSPDEVLETSPKTPFKPKRSEPVKIHSAKSTSKNWDESELGNISMGQDLLALENIDENLDGTELGFSGRRLWGFNSEQEEKPSHHLWEFNENWFKEKDDEKEANAEEIHPHPSPKGRPKAKSKEISPPNAHYLRPATTSASSFVTNTIKPIAGNVTATTLHNMRELQQSTVNNVVRPVSNATEKAIHKIGDLQDEAVGVVEGIFDFGMAGLRKGLRLTGLQDNPEVPHPNKYNKSVQHEVSHAKQGQKNVPKLVKLGHVSSSSEDSKLLKNSEPVKQLSEPSASKISQTVKISPEASKTSPEASKMTEITGESESIENIWMNPLSKDSPNGFENQMLLESDLGSGSNEVPDAVIAEPNIFFTDSPEYEETADLASTISKLRSLLQQKSSESSLNTPAVSPMPIDDKLIDDKSTPTDSIPDGGMQRFARTVTGMFNTFKTALPGNVSEQQTKKDQWIFIENEPSDTDLPSILHSLLIERRDYCTVDTAYEAMDSLDFLTDSITSQIGKIQWETPYEDELDDLDSSIPLTKALLDIICECLQETNCNLTQEPVMKALLVIAGKKTEGFLSQFSEKILRYVNRLIGPLPKNNTDDVLAMNLDKLVGIIEKSLPYSIHTIFGPDIKIALQFFISSLQSVKINQDITLQLFELICSQLIHASGQMSPTPSA